MSPVFRRAGERPTAPRRPRLVAMTVATLLVGSGYGAAAQGGGAREAGRARVAGPGSPSVVAFGKIGVDGASAVAARVALESGPAHFGEVLSGEAKELPGGIRARVYAQGEWSLSLVPRVPLRLVTDGGGGADFLGRASRLAWRTEASADYAPIVEGRPAIVARGSATGPGGQLVVIDLRMALDEQDDIGWYECRLDLSLDSPAARRLSH